MSLFRTLLQSFRAWRCRRGGPRTSNRAEVALEHLDHRQLLSAGFGGTLKFTGNTTTDFPTALLNQGVVERQFDPNTDVVADVNDPTLDTLIGRTAGFSSNGFAVTAFRVSYDPRDDSLSLGLIPPGDARIIAGDIDNSGNSAALSPGVQAYVNADPILRNTFIDHPDLQQTETMYAFLDLNGDAVPDIIAGYPVQATLTPNVPAKVYQVALADNSNPANPQFGPPLDQRFWGNVYQLNDPLHPNLEFQISSFGELYSTFNGGAPISDQSVISVGVVANSVNNPVLNGTFLRLKTIPINQATLPDPCPPVVPPVVVPILVNPHENFHINTSHPTDVKVAVFGTDELSVDQIIQSSVRFGGATPYAALPPKDLNRDGKLDEVFLFRGNEINLPPGLTTGTITGNLTTGGTFAGTSRVFNRDYGSATPSQIAAQDQRRQRLGQVADLTPLQKAALHGQIADRAVADVLRDSAFRDAPDIVNGPPRATSAARPASNTVAIPMRASARAPIAVNTGIGAYAAASSTPTEVSIPGLAPNQAARKIKVDMAGARRAAHAPAGYA
jgi:hypothetical protein